MQTHCFPLEADGLLCGGRSKGSSLDSTLSQSDDSAAETRTRESFRHAYDGDDEDGRDDEQEWLMPATEADRKEVRVPSACDEDEQPPQVWPGGGTGEWESGKGRSRGGGAGEGGSERDGVGPASFRSWYLLGDSDLAAGARPCPPACHATPMKQGSTCPSPPSLSLSLPAPFPLSTDPKPPHPPRCRPAGVVCARDACASQVRAACLAVHSLAPDALCHGCVFHGLRGPNRLPGCHGRSPHVARCAPHTDLRRLGGRQRDELENTQPDGGERCAHAWHTSEFAIACGQRLQPLSRSPRLDRKVTRSLESSRLTPPLVCLHRRCGFFISACYSSSSSAPL